MRESVELVTGIAARDWNTDEENAHVERVRAKVMAARKQRKPRRLATGEHPAARAPGSDTDRPSWTGTEG